MRGKRGNRGAALLEFAMALPFALTVFLGIGDFSIFFWRQTEMEEIARLLTSQIAAESAQWVQADEKSLARLSESFRESVKEKTGHPRLALTFTRQYACPSPGGDEQTATALPQNCVGERIYLRVESDEVIEPIFKPLQWTGFPKTAFSRHVLRLR